MRVIRWSTLRFVSLVLLMTLTAWSYAQEDTPDTFGEVMQYLSDILDNSASVALQASTQSQLNVAIEQMSWVNDEAKQLIPPITPDAYGVHSAMLMWADFQLRAFVNYPDRTYQYLYEDARSQFNALCSALPTNILAQPYALVSLDQQPPDAVTVEPQTPLETTGALTLIAQIDVPASDSTALTYSPDAKFLIRMDAQSSTWIDLNTLEPTSALLASRMAMDIAFSASPPIMVTANLDLGVTSWDLDSLQALVSLPSEQLVTHVVVNADASQIISAGADGFTVWEYIRSQHFFKGSMIQDLALSPDARYLVVAVAPNSAAETGVYIFDTRTWEVVQYWEPRADAPNPVISALVISPDSRLVAVVCYQTGVCLRDLKSGETSQELDTSVFALDAAFSPDGQYLAVVGGEYMHVYNVADGALLYQQTVLSEGNNYQKVSFSPDGRHIATANRQNILIFALP
jgi:WD40 repeat protein